MIPEKGGFDTPNCVQRLPCSSDSALEHSLTLLSPIKTTLKQGWGRFQAPITLLCNFSFQTSQFLYRFQITAKIFMLPVSQTFSCQVFFLRTIHVSTTTTAAKSRNQTFSGLRYLVAKKDALEESCVFACTTVSWDIQSNTYYLILFIYLFILQSCAVKPFNNSWIFYGIFGRSFFH